MLKSWKRIYKLYRAGIVFNMLQPVTYRTRLPRHVYDIEILAAPSILGLRPSGVEKLAETFLSCGLAEALSVYHPVKTIPTLNHLYSTKRDVVTQCLNSNTVRQFSVALSREVKQTIQQKRFALVLGGDCSILIGACVGLRAVDVNCGLIFMDAHADFYASSQSVSGEVADMDLAIVTGSGPVLLTDIHGQRPYIPAEHVIHIGQRDWKETKRYQSNDIRSTAMHRFSYSAIKNNGVDTVITRVLATMRKSSIKHWWIHFDTDVLNDAINPAVDYRLKGGLSFRQTSKMLKRFLGTGKIAGMTVTIFNPALDADKRIARNLVRTLSQAFL
jgi:arginase